ncbi:hypothetical protein B0G93_107100 [Bacillus sp. V-88]|jgi:hypothetical protein|nr:hypothetical protein B1B00_09740 [Bacillus sp. DSM 27956]PRX76816.1 hypothetical protein B0G93_107100 [Bacillus sp. V-88]SLK22040.1 hypothetical protein SAMN06295884_107100 [Bacillus sp. V-88]
MGKKYSTHTIYTCSLINTYNENANVENILEKKISQSLDLLTIVMKNIHVNSKLSQKAHEKLQEFDRIRNYGTNGLPSIHEEYWSIEEVTILIIMIRTSTHKRYDSMRKTILEFIETGKVPTQKVLQPNLDWLLKAYECIGRLKYTKWSSEIKEDDLRIITPNPILEASINNMNNVEMEIKESNVLEDEFDSVIGQILSKCAYPELIRENKEGYDVQLIGVISDIIFELEKIDGSVPQMIALNESIKKLEKISEDIRFSFNTSKYYSDEYWGKVTKDMQEDKLIKEIEKVIKEKFQVELDTIKKNVF